MNLPIRILDLRGPARAYSGISAACARMAYRKVDAEIALVMTSLRSIIMLRLRDEEIK